MEQQRLEIEAGKAEDLKREEQRLTEEREAVEAK